MTASEMRTVYEQGYLDGQKAYKYHIDLCMKESEGKWLRKNNENYSPFDGFSPYIFICDKCNGQFERASNFCPDCGNKKEKGVESI